MKNLPMLGLLCIGLPLGLRGETISVSPVADTSLQADSANNYGGHYSLFSGNRVGPVYRALVRYDLSQKIPTNALVTSAAVVFINLSRRDNGGNHNLHRLLADWGEGSKQGDFGAPATTGEATWFHRFYPDQTWSTPGGDYVAEHSGTISFSANSFRASTPALAADVQLWVQNPSTNFGWMVKCDQEAQQSAKRWAARELDPQYPALQVTYSLPLQITAVNFLTKDVQLHFLQQTGRIYTVEGRASLSEGTWETITNLPPLSQESAASVVVPAAGTSRYYRIRME